MGYCSERKLVSTSEFIYYAQKFTGNQSVKLNGDITLTVTDGELLNNAMIQANNPVTLLLHNRSPEDLFISLWVLNARLAVQRLYPANSDCLLLAKGRQIRIPVLVDKSSNTDVSEKILFKVIATRQPATLDVLQLPALEQPVDLAALLAYEQSRNDNSSTVSSATTEISSENTPRSYSNPDRPWSPGGPVAVTAKLWQPGQILRVLFLDGDLQLQQRVKLAAHLWSDAANIHFMFTHESEAEIRISFMGDGVWSYVGTDCLSVPLDQPTMNFGWLQADSPELELSAIVLRQFGHALGLVNADQSPVANIPWNREAVYRHYAKHGWSKAQVDSNIFQQYSPEIVRVGPADALSIMHRPISAELTFGGFAIAGNQTELSEADKTFIRQLYPPQTSVDKEK